jgi:hypothetical protein
MSSEDDKQYTQELYKVLTYSNTQFDKQVLFIASGALGISFAFIDKLVPQLDSATNKCFLIYSWYAFAGVIFISLVSHLVSSFSIRWRIENPDNEEGVKTWNYSIRALNILMIIGLLIGSILLINFINSNI